MEEPSPEHPSNREMLAHLSAILAPVLVLVQAGVLLLARWERVEMIGWDGSNFYEHTLNPWILWMPFFVGILWFTAWYGMRRKLGRRHRWSLALCMVTAVAIAFAGLTMDPPPRQMIRDRQDSPFIPGYNFPNFPND